VFGLLIDIGLELIGVPGAPLWGLIAMIMRFVPYMGCCICGIPDRSRCCSGIGLGDEVWTAVLFVVFELLAGQVLEPLRSVLCRSPLSTLRYSVPAKGRPSEDAQDPLK
jgi:predicted PurR-regulated permease PerM